MTKTTTIEDADIAIAHAAAPLRDTPPVKALGWLSELADQPPLMSICAATLVFGLITRNARLARTGARMLAAEMLATKIKSFVKHRVDRTRPHVEDEGGEYRMAPGSNHASEVNSFPSGHTAGAVAVARAIASDYPEHKLAATLVAGGVAAIQIPRSKHYLSDLAAGALVGVIAVRAARLAEVPLTALLGSVPDAS